MGRFERLTSGKGKKVTIDGETFQLSVLDGKYLGLLMEMSEKEQDPDTIVKLIHASFQKEHPDITFEDIQELPIKELQDLMETVLEINELT